MQIMPCTREQIPAVVELLDQGGVPTGAPSPAELVRYVEETYFDNPWYDPEVSSLVCEDRSGRIDGFLGVIARPMTLGGQPVRAAASSNFRVRGGDQATPRNPLIAMRLLRRFFDGPQELSVANGANPLSKKVWEGSGGLSVPLYSLDWFRMIRPARGLLELAAGQRSKPWPAALRQLSDGADSLVGHRLARRSTSSDQATGVLTELDPAFAAEHLATATGFDLVPRYDAASFAWVLEMCRRKALRGRLRAMAVREPGGGRDLGWFVYYEKRARVGEVIQMVAAPGQLRAVLHAAIADAEAQGLALLRGDVDSRDLQAYRDEVCLLNTGRWMLVHSRRQAVTDTFLRGTALFSGLDGERWIREFGRAPI